MEKGKRGLKYFAVGSAALLCLVFATGRILTIAIPQESKPVKTKQGEYFVTWVIDGDTIEIQGGERVRYLGIDTPEKRRRHGNQWIKDPEPYAEEAFYENMRMVKGKKVRLEFDVKKRDKYGRLLAHVFVDDVFVNRELVKKGFASVLTIKPNLRYSAEFKRLENEAKKNKLGMWKEIRE